MLKKSLKYCFIVTFAFTTSFLFASCKSISSNLSSESKPISFDLSTYAEGTPVVSEPIEEIDTPQEEAPTLGSVPTPSPSENTPTEPTPEAPSTPSDNKSDVVVVQRANTETGISWDGVSPIIYTYPDGSTGTEKRDGATYEQVPGMIATVNLDAENYVSDYDGTCPQCGKKGWDGTNGTCGSWLQDINCPNCGEYVKAYTCHTCDE